VNFIKLEEKLVGSDLGHMSSSHEEF
jgi:hypothetical protein